MTKKIFAIIIAVVVCLSMTVSASAQTTQYIYDPDYHLTDSEIYELESYAANIERQNGYAIIFCIISDNGGMTLADFAEEACYSYTDTENAVVYVHDTEEELYDYYIAGDSKGIFSDSVLAAMETAYNSDKSYFGGLMGFYAAAEAALEAGAYNTAPEDDAAVTNAPASDESNFVPVDRTLPLVVDNADIISDDVESALLARCETIAAEYEMEVAIVTTNDLDGKSSKAYADDFYDFNGYGYGENDDGMLVVYKPGKEGERDIYITTHGEGQSVFFDGITDGIVTEMIEYLSVEDYESAFNHYLDRAEGELKPGVSVVWLLGLAVIGAVIGLVITGSMVSKNKTVFARNHAKVYTRQGSMNVTGAQDVFAYSHVTSTPKVQNNNNNNTSGSSHTSSSGRTHGGSGATF